MRQRLRDRVMISRRVATDGDYRDVETYTALKTRRCDIKPLRSKEDDGAAGESIDVTYQITFRYEKGLLLETDRLTDARQSPARVFDDLKIIDVDNMHNRIIVTCKERKWPRRA